MRQPRYTKLVRESNREFSRRDNNDNHNSKYGRQGHHHKHERQLDRRHSGRSDREPRMMGRMQAWDDGEDNNRESAADYHRTNQRLMQMAGIRKGKKDGHASEIIRSEQRAERRPSCDDENASMNSRDKQDNNDSD